MSELCPDGPALLEYVEGRATPEAARRIEDHLTVCSACETEAAILRTQSDAFGAAATGRAAAARPAHRLDGCVAGSCGEGFDAAAYVSGGLDESARARYERHVSKCATCFEELSDLIAARRAEAPVPGDAAVATALARLRSEPNRVAFRISAGALRFADGWIEAARNFTVATGFESRQPALAGVRSGNPPVTVHWESEGGYSFDCELTGDGRRTELVGRVLRDGAPAIDVSVSLRGLGVPRGPESVDSQGRFGPWSLEPGSSELRFQALRLPEGSLSVTLDVGDDPATAAEGRD